MSEWLLTEKPYSEHTIEQEIARRKGAFISDFLEKQKASLGLEAFEKKKEKLQREGEKRWQIMRDAKLKLLDLEEKMRTEVMDWASLEKLYRAWLEAEGHPKDVVENTISARRRDFETAQTVLKERLKSTSYNADEDFRERVLNPETRQQAIQHFLRDRADKAHFLIETIQLLFEELDRLKRR